jgi:ribosome maturation factor RimP
VGFPPTFFFSGLTAVRDNTVETRVDEAMGVEGTPGSPVALERALVPVVEAFGLELLDSENAGGTLRVVVEGESPLDLDRLAEVSQAVSAFLDAHPELAPNHRYELEVSTPGLERRLRRAAHFTRVVGRRVAVRTVPAAPGDRRAEGTLVRADEHGISLTLDDGSTRDFSYDQIDRAHTVFDWKAELASSKRGTRHTQDAGASR